VTVPKHDKPLKPRTLITIFIQAWPDKQKEQDFLKALKEHGGAIKKKEPIKS